MFNLTKRNAKIKNVNFRVEQHGDEEKTAADISIVVGITKRDFHVLAPITGESKKANLIETFYTPNGDLRAPYIASLFFDRKPEGLVVTIHDHAANRSKKPLVFEGVHAKDLAFHFDTNFKGTLTLKLQVMVQTTQGVADRLADILGKDREIEVKSTQNDLFADEDDEEEEEE